MAAEGKTPHRTIRVEDDLWEALREAAEEEGMDASKVIRWLVQGWLDGR